MPLAKLRPLSYWGWGGQDKPTSSPGGLVHISKQNSAEQRKCCTKVLTLTTRILTAVQWDLDGTRILTQRPQPGRGCGPVRGVLWVQPGHRPLRISRSPHGGSQPGHHTAAALHRLPTGCSLRLGRSLSPPHSLSSRLTGPSPSRGHAHGAHQLSLPSGACLHPSRHEFASQCGGPGRAQCSEVTCT